MIAIITNRLDPHADEVIRHLKAKGAKFTRFNTEDFPQRCNFSWQITDSTIDGTLSLPGGHKILLSEVGSVWYRRPVPPVVSKDLLTSQAKEFAEDESKVLLKGLWPYLSKCFWINYPPKVHQADSKINNLKLAAEIGFVIPQTLITTNPQAAKDFFHECHGRVVNKTLGKGQVEYQRDYYFVYAHKVLADELDRIESVKYAPALFQEYIPKSVEIRATVVGSKVFSCEIHSQESQKTLDDWRHYDFENVKHIVHQLPQSIELLCLKMVEKLGLNFATLDLILTPDNEYVFLELNPNGQWLWIEQLTGLPISSSIAELLLTGVRK